MVEMVTMAVEMVDNEVLDVAVAVAEMLLNITAVMVLVMPVVIPVVEVIVGFAVGTIEVLVEDVDVEAVITVDGSSERVTGSSSSLSEVVDKVIEDVELADVVATVASEVTVVGGTQISVVVEPALVKVKVRGIDIEV